MGFPIKEILSWGLAALMAGSVGKDIYYMIKGMPDSDAKTALEEQLRMTGQQKATQREAAKEMLTWLEQNNEEARRVAKEDQQFLANQEKLRQQHEMSMLNRQIAGQAALSEAEPYELAPQQLEAGHLATAPQFDPNIPITALL